MASAARSECPREPWRSPSAPNFERPQSYDGRLFDGVEQSKSVQPRLDRLHRLSSVDETLHHPPRVKIAWVSAAGAMPTFDGVVEAVSVRYLTLAENGVAATCDSDREAQRSRRPVMHARSRLDNGVAVRVPCLKRRR